MVHVTVADMDVLELDSDNNNVGVAVVVELKDPAVVDHEYDDGVADADIDNENECDPVVSLTDPAPDIDTCTETDPP